MTNYEDDEVKMSDKNYIVTNGMGDRWNIKDCMLVEVTDKTYEKMAADYNEDWWDDIDVTVAKSARLVPLYKGELIPVTEDFV